MQSGPDLQSKWAHPFTDRTGTPDRARRSVKCGKQSVTRGVYFSATKGGEFFAHGSIEVIQQLTPLAVPLLGGRLGGADDVREHHGGEHPVRFGAVPNSGDEFLDLVDKNIEHILIQSLEHMVVAGKLDVLGSRDVLGEVSPHFDRDETITRAMGDQGRHLDRRQNVPNVDLIVGAQ